MNFDQVLELVRTVSDSELTAFQYEEGNQRITMQAGGLLLNGTGFDGRTNGGNTVFYDMTDQMSAKREAQSVPQTKILQNVSGVETIQSSMVSMGSTSGADTSVGNVVTSPLVGRFYAAPAEDAEAFVKIGDTVKKGQVLAIVEAMKLMNEIESDYDGVVAEILVDNGQGVEYGQPLFRIRA